MNYVVNDIEGILNMDKIGALDFIYSVCNEVFVTDVRVEDFSGVYKARMNRVYKRGVKEVQSNLTSIARMIGGDCNEIHLVSHADISSICLAQEYECTLVTSNRTISSIATFYNVPSISTSEFFGYVISDTEKTNFFNKLMINEDMIK